MQDVVAGGCLFVVAGGCLLLLMDACSSLLLVDDGCRRIQDGAGLRLE